MSLIDRLFQKRGITSPEELAPEELEQVEKWKQVLRGETVTVETLKEFCTSQIKLIESKVDGVNSLSMLQQACLHVYFNLLKAIEAPEQERESLERYLTQLIEK